MTNHFTATTFTQEDGQPDYTLDVYVNPWTKDMVSLQVIDGDDEHTITRFSPERARDIAQQLTAAAKYVEDRVPAVGSTVKTLGQLNNLPRKTVLLTDENRPAIKGDNPDHPNAWSLISGPIGPESLFGFFSPLTVVHIPEEN